MRARILEAPRRLSLVELPDPAAVAGEVVIRVAATGVCGTDRHIFNGDYSVAYPATLGHEYSGEVVMVGEGVTSLTVGDRVTVDPNIVDDECYFCRRGVDHLCSALSPLGVARPGGFAEFSVLPVRYAYRVPDTLTWQEAAQVEPLACCVHGIDQAGVTTGDVVAITGAGPIGCLLIQLVRMQGAAKIVAIEPNAARRDHAIAAGADVACAPEDAERALRSVRAVEPDVWIEASGIPGVAESAIDMVRRGGTVLLFARTDPQTQTARGVSAFIVDTDDVTITRTEEKLGLNSSVTNDIAVDSVVADDRLIGELNHGFRIAMSTLDGGRIGIAAQAVGIAQAAYEVALRYAKEREAFGQRIADFQAIQHKLANMSMEIDAARLLVLRAATLKDRGLPHTEAGAKAKLFASEMARRQTAEAIQVLGGYGYTKEFPVERYYRDAKITEIYEGTSEIQRLVIAREILGRA